MSVLLFLHPTNEIPYVHGSPLRLHLRAVLVLLLRIHVLHFRLNTPTHGNDQRPGVVSVDPLLDFRQPEKNSRRELF